ncbi:MAG: hypothetical protein HYZ26_02270 [Chloroflexi bacterium]|nr:hypothetical protein [Chloroflexota bacterium]
MKIPKNLRAEIDLAKRLLANIPSSWDSKASVLQLKEANFNWRQMEWWGFYFEHLCREALKRDFAIPGDQYGSRRTASFDAKRTINWDFKAKAIKSDDHRAILNDCAGMQASINQYSAHGLVLALCDVEYNDENRSFQKWHEELKGGKSRYTLEREQRTSVSRYRKTRADLQEILFLVVTARNVDRLSVYSQGRNSNGRPRPPKFMLDLESVEGFFADRLIFES